MKIIDIYELGLKPFGFYLLIKINNHFFWKHFYSRNNWQ